MNSKKNIRDCFQKESAEWILAGQTTALMQDIVNDHAPDTISCGNYENTDEERKEDIFG